MNAQSESEPRAQAPYIYGKCEALNGLAIGLWQGVAAWFLYKHLHLTPTELALVYCVPLVAQLVLEVPSGTWADTERKRNLLVFSFLGFFVYASVYAILGAVNVRGDADAMHTWNLIGAAGAELVYGIAMALLSGTFVAWIAESERTLSDDDLSDFTRRLNRVASLKESWGTGPKALVGAAAFCLAIIYGGWALLVPWFLAAACYLVTVWVIWSQVKETGPKAKDTLWQTLTQMSSYARYSELVPFYSYRSLSYLREHPATLTVFWRSSLTYSVFFSLQLFTIVYLDRMLDVTAASRLQYGIPLLPLIWGAGEFARAAGASQLLDHFRWLLGRSATSDGEVRLLVPLFVLFAGLAVQILAPLQQLPKGLEPVQCFLLGFLLFKVAEGRLRRQLGVAVDRSILTERATLRSFESLFRALSGLLVYGVVGPMMRFDCISAYLVIAGIAFISFMLEVVVPTVSAPRVPTTPPASPDRRRRAVPLLYLFLLVMIGFLFFSWDGLLWSWLSRDRIAVSAEAIGQDVLIEEGLRSGSPTEQSERERRMTTWRLQVTRSTDKVKCKVFLPSSDLPGVTLSESAEASEAHTRDGETWLQFELSESACTIRIPSTLDSPFRCYRASGTPESIVPVVYSTPSVLRLADVLVGVLVVWGVIVVIGLGWLGHRYVVSNLQRSETYLQLTQSIGRDCPQPMTRGVAMDDLRSSLAEGDIAGLLDRLHATDLILGGFDLSRMNRTPIIPWMQHFDREGEQTSRHDQTRAVDEIWSLLKRENKEVYEADSDRSTLHAGLNQTVRMAANRLSESGRDLQVTGCFQSEPGRRDAFGSRTLSVGFVLVIYRNDAAARYLDVLERELRDGIADRALTEQLRFQLQEDAIDLVHDLGTWSGDVRSWVAKLSKGGLNASDVMERLDFFYKDSQAFRAEQLGRAGSDQLVLFSHWFEQLCRLEFDKYSTELGGDLKIDLRMDASWKGQAGTDTRLQVRRITHELVLNAKRHGRLDSEDNLVLRIEIEPRDDELYFRFTNAGASDSYESEMARGVAGCDKRIRALGGEGLQIVAEGGNTVATFGFPLKLFRIVNNEKT